MNSAQAKREIDMNDYLQSNGYKSVKNNGSSFWYLSPFRTEKTASFVVNEKTNTFIDWGTGQKGTIIDLVMLLSNTDVSESLKILSRCKKTANYSSSSFSSSFKKQNIPETKKSIPGRIEKITHPWIKTYLRNRGIKEEIWSNCEFLFQYVYPNPTPSKSRFPFFYNPAWKNDNGGYEVNNRRFKSCLLKKDITTIPGNTFELNVFEGFFDYLSALVYYNKKHLRGMTIVLNSVVLLDRIIPTLNKNLTINVYVDNDKAGELAFSKIDRNFKHVIDKSKQLYPNYKDFNEFLLQKHKK